MSWVVTDLGHGIHVVPKDDILLHDPTPACACVPKIESQSTTCLCSGKIYIRQVVVHAAMDGRSEPE